MATRQLSSVVRYLRTVRASRLAASLTDATLLERFISQRDEAAFEALVSRHGPMVFGLCRRVLGNAHDAEDAFQATFLVLVHKAGSVRKRTSLGHWLYGVAYRTALQARSDRARRRVHERKGATMDVREPVSEILCQEVRSVLDEEIHRLPEKYRTPVVLCYLEGKTYEEAGRQLRWPKGTVAIRLARARERLRTNLVRRGIGLSDASLGTAVPASLLTSTVQAATLTATGQTALVSLFAGRAVTLSKAVLGTLSMTSLKTTLTVLVALGAVTIGPGLLLQQVLVAKLAPAAAASQPHAALSPQLPDAPAAKPPPRGTAPDGSNESKYDARPLARRWWAIMELIEKTHLEPCSRRDMILAGATALLHVAKTPAPADLERRVSGIANVEQLATFLAAIWPNTGSTPNEKLEIALLEGMLKKIPGEPQLLTAVHTQVSNQLSGNRYVGIGIQLGMNKEEKVPQILNPFRSGAARKAGAMAGDLLVEVEGKSTYNIELTKIVEWLRGEEGTGVTIGVRKPGSTEKRSLQLIRAVISIDTCLGYRRGSEESWTYRVDPAVPVGYVRVDSIRASTLHELRKLESQLQAEGCRALVLDFRSSNGAGVFYHAALVADGLLDGGLMWSVRDAHGEVKEFRADRECLFRNWPLAVLVDKELADRAHGGVIAALQDNGRAIVVGELPKCDGYVNAVLPLPERGESLVLRTARMERAAKGKSWPIQPDYLVPLNDAQRTAVLAWLRQKEQAELPAGTDNRPPDDPQLNQAIQLVRAALEAQDQPGRR
jgi:RNA polymerase sigma-70 factor (ECF subfamily)